MPQLQVFPEKIFVLFSGINCTLSDTRRVSGLTQSNRVTFSFSKNLFYSKFGLISATIDNLTIKLKRWKDGKIWKKKNDIVWVTSGSRNKFYSRTIITLNPHVTRIRTFLSRSAGFVIFAARFFGRTPRRKCSKLQVKRDETTQSSGGPFFPAGFLVFFSPLFPLFLLDFAASRGSQLAQEPTSFPMHQEDVRTAWPASFHSFRFRRVRDFACTYSNGAADKGERSTNVEKLHSLLSPSVC